jgi:hypothetical protein
MIGAPLLVLFDLIAFLPSLRISAMLATTARRWWW